MNDNTNDPLVFFGCCSIGEITDLKKFLPSFGVTVHRALRHLVIIDAALARLLVNLISLFRLRWQIIFSEEEENALRIHPARFSVGQLHPAPGVVVFPFKSEAFASFHFRHDWRLRVWS